MKLCDCDEFAALFTKARRQRRLGTCEALKTGGGTSGGEPVELLFPSHLLRHFSLLVHFPFTTRYFP
jgi:hypothetical protein